MFTKAKVGTVDVLALAPLSILPRAAAVANAVLPPRKPS